MKAKVVFINSVFLILGIVLIYCLSISIRLSQKKEKINQINSVAKNQINMIEKSIYPLFTNHSGALPDHNGLLSEIAKSTLELNIYPLNPMPDVMTYYGAEGISKNAKYLSDKHGFRNSNNVYNGSTVDYLLIGDSFGQSSASELQYGLSEHLSGDHNFNGINISVGSSGAPEYLGLIREFIVESIEGKLPVPNNIILLVADNDWAHPCFFPTIQSNGICEIAWKYLNNTEYKQNIFKLDSSYRSNLKEFHKILTTKTVNFKPVTFWKTDNVSKEILSYIKGDVLQAKIFIKHKLLNFEPQDDKTTNSLKEMQIPAGGYGIKINNKKIINPAIKYFNQIYIELRSFCEKVNCNVYTVFTPSKLDIDYYKNTTNHEEALYPSKYFYEEIAKLAISKSTYTCDTHSFLSKLSSSRFISPEPFTSKTGGHYTDKGYKLLSDHIAKCIHSQSS